jgi:hypothetical protein
VGEGVGGLVAGRVGLRLLGVGLGVGAFHLHKMSLVHMPACLPASRPHVRPLPPSVLTLPFLPLPLGLQRVCCRAV